VHLHVRASYRQHLTRKGQISRVITLRSSTTEWKGTDRTKENFLAELHLVSGPLIVLMTLKNYQLHREQNSLILSPRQARPSSLASRCAKLPGLTRDRAVEFLSLSVAAFPFLSPLPFDRSFFLFTAVPLIVFTRAWSRRDARPFSRRRLPKECS